MFFFGGAASLISLFLLRLALMLREKKHIKLSYNG
ncbi:hypothetical protein CDSM653_01994 [Caldanaerobacter subterraneus subsp. pacificus DSM 12653]|uniref:Uncharacterized protein n=1 Tax=Caldanaerobacter subterraneus subsp. pacificus DSM 12653 TaxID=391606 RepID=A0A0F5PKM0_9THEO|nr:hypothetical protein CDSM653_01994 [Caldanaerobacter subterraneus subsp. pacificus DSM 12653]